MPQLTTDIQCPIPHISSIFCFNSPIVNALTYTTSTGQFYHTINHFLNAFIQVFLSKFSRLIL